VTATGAGGESGRSNEASATPQAPATPPAAPTGLAATTGNGQVALTWNSVAGATTYSVYRGTTAGGETLLQSGLTVTTFTSNGLTNGTTYFYQVTATGAGGESGRSNEASATPQAPVSPPTAVPPNIAVGSDSGFTSTLKVYSPAAQLLSTSTPFGAITGGVRTADADFTGDGTPDVAVGTGPGTSALVKVLDGKTGQVAFQVAPFELSFTSGVFVAAGDVTGDGIADLIVTPDQNGGPRVEVFRGGDFAVAGNFFGIKDPDFRGGARAAAGDLNGDGFADIVVSAGFSGGPRISVWDGKAFAAGQERNLVPDFFLFEAGLRNGAYVAVGDVDGDGSADVIGGAGPGGGPRVLVISGRTLLSPGGSGAAIAAPVANFFGGDSNNRGGIRVTTKDLDGDTRADIVVGAGEGGGNGVTGYLGRNFAGGSAPEAFSLEAFPGFNGGVFVG
jgi:hypothetical protein